MNKKPARDAMIKALFRERVGRSLEVASKAFTPAENALMAELMLLSDARVRTQHRRMLAASTQKLTGIAPRGPGRPRGSIDATTAENFDLLREAFNRETGMRLSRKRFLEFLNAATAHDGQSFTIFSPEIAQDRHHAFTTSNSGRAVKVRQRIATVEAAISRAKKKNRKG